MQPDVSSWLKHAQSDLGVAKHLWGTYHPTPLEIICYHCQQSAEKAIKGLYLVLNIPGGVPKKHDLSFLLDQIKNRVSVTEEIFNCADDLNAFGVVVRYPSEIYVDEISTQKAIYYAEKVYEWVRSVVDASSD